MDKEQRCKLILELLETGHHKSEIYLKSLTLYFDRMKASLSEIKKHVRDLEKEHKTNL